LGLRRVADPIVSGERDCHDSRAAGLLAWIAAIAANDRSPALVRIDRRLTWIIDCWGSAPGG
ncbi:MAG: hypothetical protein WAK86_04865, partial [Pseudonocardiaceae bacterium]